MISKRFYEGLKKFNEWEEKVPNLMTFKQSLDFFNSALLFWIKYGKYEDIDEERIAHLTKMIRDFKKYDIRSK